MVLVLQGGSVSQQILTLAEPVTQEVLSNTAQAINHILRDPDGGACAGENAHPVRRPDARSGRTGR